MTIRYDRYVDMFNTCTKQFLLTFVDLVRVCLLLIISRNHFNTFLLLDLQKKVK